MFVLSACGFVYGGNIFGIVPFIAYVSFEISVSNIRESFSSRREELKLLLFMSFIIFYDFVKRFIFAMILGIHGGKILSY